MPYERDPNTLVRKWALPGEEGTEHRIGGLEKLNRAGNISYDPANHELMVHLRAQKIENIALDVAPLTVNGPESGELLIVSWGSTYGAIAGAISEAKNAGLQAAHVHLRMLNPFPKNFPEILSRYRTVLVPELNSGQLAQLIKAKYLIPVESFTKIQGQPFFISEILAKIHEYMTNEKTEQLMAV